MTASTPPGAFYIVPYASLIPSHEEDCEPVWPNEQGKPEPINPTIARVMKEVHDNPTPKADE